MSWTSRSALSAPVCTLLLLLSSQQSHAQWFVGNLSDTTNHADYIIITSAANVNAVQPLAAFRASQQSLSVVMVLLDSITAQFPRATPDSSVRDFVTRTLTHWQVPHPQFLLLAGNVNVVPSHKIASSLAPYFGEDSLMIDQWLVSGLTQSQEHPTPGMAIGRFPAWTAGDLSTMVSKTIAYELMTTSGWAARSIAVADSADQGVFEADAAEQQQHAEQRWHDTITVHIRANSPAYKTRRQFLSLWSQGCAVMSFVGQMNGWQFSRDAYFTIQDIDSLATGSPLPLCLTAGSQRFEWRDSIPMAVALLQAPARGAVCVLAPSGLMYEAANLNFTNRLFDYLSQHPNDAIGTAWLSVIQQQFDDLEQRRTLFGDPALVMKSSTIASTGVPGAHVPSAYALFQNYPNPFNPSTMIRYGLPQRSHVTLSVFNTLGQRVAHLVDGDMEAGYHEVKFDGTQLSSGAYFYRIQAGSFVETKRLLMIR